MNIVLQHLSKTAQKHGKHITRVLDENYIVPEDLEISVDHEYIGYDGNRLYADIIRPSGAVDSKLPVVIFVHGGGLFLGDRKFNRPFCEILARMGFVVYSLEYRFINDTDAFGEIKDICSGISFLLKTAPSFGGDCKNVYMVGESAGAFLALYAAALCGSEDLRSKLNCPAPNLKVKGLVFFSGMFYAIKSDPVSMVYRKDMFGDRLKNKELKKLLNPDNEEIISCLPPVFLTSSSGDFIAFNTRSYAKALKKSGHSCKLVYYKSGRHLIHAFPSLLPFLPESAEVMTKMKHWMKKI